MIVVVCLSVLASVAVFQTAYTAIYVWKLQQPSRPVSDFRPAVNIVLCVRGFDAEVSECLRSLDALDYPAYELTIVFDSQRDPAVEPIRELLESELSLRSRLLFIDPVQETGSLKCQALCTAIIETRDTTEVFAFVDGDSIVDPNWLRDLVQPLQDEHVGATTGNRYFVPGTGSVGGDLQSAWNSAAVVQMLLYKIAWGGSFAMRKETLVRIGMVNVWKDKFCEDTVLGKSLKQHRLKLHRVPELIVVNEGSASFGSVANWITRQLITSRWYVDFWPLVLLHATSVGICLLICVSSLFSLLFAFSMLNLTWVIAGLGFQILNFSLVTWIDRANLRILAHRRNVYVEGGSDFDRRQFDGGGVLAKVIAVCLSQVVQPYAAWKAQLDRSVVWRKVRYSFRRDGTVVVNDYRPYGPDC